jgi:hypothetical protein
MVMLATGCAATSDGADDVSSPDAQGDAEDEIIAADPLAMPKPLVAYLRTQSWGTHHLEWHTVRRWDRISPSDQAYAKRQGWARADVMEGAKGNGLEFLPSLPDDVVRSHAELSRVQLRLVFVTKARCGAFRGGGSMPPFSREALSDEDLAGILAYFAL